MLENVRGFLDSGFDEYRDHIFTSIQKLGYVTHIKLLNASDYGVPQLRPRVVIIGIRKDQIGAFAYPDEQPDNAPTVGDTLRDLMAQNGWEGAKQWASNANRIAPTLVGGSKKHGGPDLGPTRARNAWAELGVDGRGIANEAPAPGFEGMPRLTSRMMARIQGFPAVSDIVVAHSWFRSLSGLDYASGFSAERILHEYEVALNTVILGEQAELLEPIRALLRRTLGVDAASLQIVNRPPTRSKPLYMKVWEARKADGLDYDPDDERQQRYLSEITRYNLTHID